MNAALKNKPDGVGYAFFDVDDTLISVKSMLSFQDFWYERFNEHQARELYYNDLRQHMHESASWEVLNRLYYQHFAGRRVADVEQCGEAWFAHMEEKHPDLFHKIPLAELKHHQDEGREVVFVSGSFPAILKPVARVTKVRHILSTLMEVENECYTGRILTPQTIGAGKAEAIRIFLASVNGVAEHCYAYGDDISDLPMLQSVGKPTVVRGGRGLEQRAQELGWRIISPV
ncbi:MAG TPA: HAD-IB family hydrolase [Cellvibrio sp.]|jgi:HAD superfamily hydrolase (TIGR01490 family)|nr:HAD-IB family hydrolase [Cellvibrio sp.]